MSDIRWEEDYEHHKHLFWCRWHSMHKAYLGDTLMAFVVVRDATDYEGNSYEEIRCYWGDSESPWEDADDLEEAKRFIERKIAVSGDELTGIAGEAA